MDNLIFKEIENIIDREIDNYEKIEKLYLDKRDILVKGDILNLESIDSKIVDQYNRIKSISEVRKNLSEKLSDKDLNLSEIISLAKKEKYNNIEKFHLQQLKLQQLAKNIQIQERNNFQLIQKGLNIVNQTIKIILDNIQVNNSEYNHCGRSQKNNIEISSIVEEV